MFVVRIGINGENTDYYFNKIRNAKKFERRLLVTVFDDIEKNHEKKYHDLYFFAKDIQDFKCTIDFDYNCDNEELKKWIMRHQNNKYYFDIETYVEEIYTLDYKFKLYKI